MKKLSDEIVHFFQSQGYVIVSTIDQNGYPSNACKGLVEIDDEGRVYLLDLYQGQTRKNLASNSRVSITAIDENKFLGYCLKGRAHMVTQDQMNPRLISAWEDKITSRVTSRLLKNIHGEKGHAAHPEALLPAPKYLIEIDVEEIVDLTPHHIRKAL